MICDEYMICDEKQVIHVKKINERKIVGKCRKFVLTRDFSCIVRRGRKYLGGVAKLF